MMIQSCSNNKTSTDNTPLDSISSLENYLNDTVTLTGIAYNSKLWTIIQVPIHSKDSIMTVNIGMDPNTRWSSEVYGKTIKVKGTLVKRYDNPVYYEPLNKLDSIDLEGPAQGPRGPAALRVYKLEDLEKAKERYVMTNFVWELL